MAYTMVQGIGKLSLKMGVLLRGSVYKQKKVRPISQCIHNTGHLSSFFYVFFPFFRPHPGEIRQIYIEKSSEALGITIKENQTKKGVFVSSVSENSLANQVGLQVKQTNLHLLIKTNGNSH